RPTRGLGLALVCWRNIAFSPATRRERKDLFASKAIHKAKGVIQLSSRETEHSLLNPAVAGIRAFRLIAPQRLGRPARPCPTRSTKQPVSRVVTSSNEANTGPMWGSSIAAALIYRLCMRRFISRDWSPEISSALPAAFTPRSAPGFRTSTIREAFGRAAILRTFRLLEDVATNR